MKPAVEDKLVHKRAMTANTSNKNPELYRRFMEIERQNRALLQNLGRIAQNNYTSLVQKQLSSRKFLSKFNLFSSQKDWKFEYQAQKRNS